MVPAGHGGWAFWSRKIPSVGTSLRFRLAAGAAVAASIAALAVPTPASAQAAPAPPGVGSTTGETTLLGLSIGGENGPLNLQVIGETATTLLDALAGAPNAVARVLPLSLTSSLLPALSGLGLAPVESRSTGAEDTRSTELLDLGALADQLGLPGLLGGAIQPASLTTAVDGQGARSIVSSAVTGLSALGGVLGLDALTLEQGAQAAPGQSTAQRGVTLASLDVLTLDGLLGLLGIPLEALPLDSALDLLGALGLPLDGLGVSSVTQLDSMIDGLLTDIGGLLGAVVGGVCDPLAPILGLLGITCTQVSGTIVDLVDQLRALVVGIVDTLTGTPLLSFDGIDLDVVTRAGATVADSVASVVSTIGGVRVAGLSLPGLDLGATLAQVDTLVDRITEVLNGLLGGIAPALGNLLDIDLLDQSTSVVQSTSGITSNASVTGLRIAITPPNVCDLLSGLGLGGTDSLGALLGGVTGALGPVGDLLEGLGIGVPCTGSGAGASTVALTAPLTIEALSVTEAATLRLPTATPVAPGTPSNPEAAPPTALARTGLPGQALPMSLAAGLLGLALLVRRRLVLAPAPVRTGR
jgi:hypothetical protein